MAKWFTDKEIEGLNPGLVEKLDKAREIAGVPFLITEGVAVGGSHVGNTSHQRGLAVDLRCWESWSRWKMVKALMEAGFVRLGIYDKHIHVDIDSSLPQRMIWVGTSH